MAEVLLAQVKRLQHDNRMLRLELTRRLPFECPMCKARRERVARANQRHRAKMRLKAS